MQAYVMNLRLKFVEKPGFWGSCQSVIGNSLFFRENMDNYLLESAIKTHAPLKLEFWLNNWKNPFSQNWHFKLKYVGKTRFWGFCRSVSKKLVFLLKTSDNYLKKSVIKTRAPQKLEFWQNNWKIPFCRNQSFFGIICQKITFFRVLPVGQEKVRIFFINFRQFPIIISQKNACTSKTRILAK